MLVNYSINVNKKRLSLSIQLVLFKVKCFLVLFLLLNFKKKINQFNYVSKSIFRK